MENSSSKETQNLSQAEFDNILSNNTITIPANLLYFYIQFTDIVSKRGAVRPDEMLSVGKSYNYSLSIINKLVESHLNKSNDVPTESVENSKKTFPLVVNKPLVVTGFQDKSSNKSSKKKQIII